VRRAAWNAAFMDELANFPHGRKDDQVDALARAFSLLISQSPAARFKNLSFIER
jgi:phage terminase large subunit-like protein